MRKFLLPALLCLSLLSQSACAGRRGLFDWGSYEAMVYQQYADSPSLTLDEQIAVLAQEVERSVEGNRRIPPGKLAHLGLLYFRKGEPSLARESFLREKKLYPESSRLMDRFASRLPK